MQGERILQYARALLLASELGMRRNTTDRGEGRARRGEGAKTQHKTY